MNICKHIHNILHEHTVYSTTCAEYEVRLFLLLIARDLIRGYPTEKRMS